MAYTNFFSPGTYESGYNANNNFVEIVAGSSNRTDPLYVEAANGVETVTKKNLASMKRFITAIEEVANTEKVKDARITSSKGNIKSFKGYHNVEVCMDFMSKNLKSVPLVDQLQKLHDSLVKFQPQYTEGYDKKVRLVVLEYESAMYMLITGIVLTINENMEVVQNGAAIKFQVKKGSGDRIIAKTVKELVQQLTNADHKEYLETMLKAVDYKPIETSLKESAFFTEGSVADTIDLIDAVLTNIGKIGHYSKRIVVSIIKSLFGIVPLIRSIIYLRYKKKADTVIALEQQASFLEQNIETVQNRKTDDPAKQKDVIKRQQAIVDAYRKKAEKLRAELTESERDAATEIQKTNQEIHDKKDLEDDFVLESVGFFGKKKEDDFEIETHDIDESQVPEHIRKRAAKAEKEYADYKKKCESSGKKVLKFDDWFAKHKKGKGFHLESVAQMLEEV